MEIKLEDRVDFQLSMGRSVLIVARSQWVAVKAFDLWADFVEAGRMKCSYVVHRDRHHISFGNGAVLQAAKVDSMEDADHFRGVAYDHLFSIADEFKNDELIARLIALTRAEHHAV